MAGEIIRVGDIVEATRDCSGAVKGEHYVVAVDSSGSGTQIARCSCVGTWKIVESSGTRKGNMKIKRVWEIVVVDSSKDIVVVRGVVIGGDDKAACANIGIRFAEDLKGVVTSDLRFIVKELGNYE